jgi:hypothetical protein
VGTVAGDGKRGYSDGFVNAPDTTADAPAATDTTSSNGSASNASTATPAVEFKKPYSATYNANG